MQYQFVQEFGKSNWYVESGNATCNKEEFGGT